MSVIFPPRGQTWTYKERTRLYSLISGLIGAAWVVFGLVAGSWLMVLLAVLVVAFAAVGWLLAERKYRAEP